MTSKEIITQLKKHSNPKDKEGMARFGINPKYALGVRIPFLRSLAKKIGKDHKLAQDLWRSKIHEARILASMIDEPKKVTEKQIEEWVREFNSWDLCDQCCMNLFDKLSISWKKAIQWTKRDEEFIRRAGFALMAQTPPSHATLGYFVRERVFLTSHKLRFSREAAFCLFLQSDEILFCRRRADSLLMTMMPLSSPQQSWLMSVQSVSLRQLLVSLSITCA